MSTNPYAPPQASLTQPSPSKGEGPLFFPVSLNKFFWMTMTTLSIYSVYWFYMNWKTVQDRTGENMIPFLRAFFSLFFCYQLLDRVRKQDPQSPAASLPAGALAGIYFLVWIASFLPDPYWLIALPGALVLMPAQKAINQLNEQAAPGHDRNASFSAWNWVAMAVGVLFTVLVLVGLSLDPEAVAVD